MASSEPLEPKGFLAYEALVLFQQQSDRADEPEAERVARFRTLFLRWFHGFGDMDPDDAVDISDG